MPEGTVGRNCHGSGRDAGDVLPGDVVDVPPRGAAVRHVAGAGRDDQPARAGRGRRSVRRAGSTWRARAARRGAARRDPRRPPRGAAAAAPAVRGVGHGPGRLLRPHRRRRAGAFHDVPRHRAGLAATQPVPAVHLAAAARPDRGSGAAGAGDGDPAPATHRHPARGRSDRALRGRGRARRRVGGGVRRRGAAQLSLARRRHRRPADLRGAAGGAPAGRRHRLLPRPAHQPPDAARAGHRRGTGGDAGARPVGEAADRGAAAAALPDPAAPDQLHGAVRAGALRRRAGQAHPERCRR